MTKYKLDEIEDMKIDIFLNSYKVLHETLDLVISDINNLKIEQAKIAERITDVRLKDDLFKVELEKRYGKGTIDIETRTYILD
jgi:hypothetical protein